MSNPVVIKGITDSLEQDKNRRWTQDELAEHVLKNFNTGFKNTHQISVAIRTLVSCGRISGRSNGDRAVNIMWKPDQDEATAAALKAAREQMEKQKRELDALRAAKPEDLTKITERLNTLVEHVKTIEQAKQEAAAERDKLAAKLKECADQVMTVRTIDAQGEAHDTKDLYHASFKKVLKLAAARKNIYIYGPTGCGKTHLADQVAKTLKLRFKFTSFTGGLSEGQLTARLLPRPADRTELMEHYKHFIEQGLSPEAAAPMAAAMAAGFSPIIAEFADCFEHGGVFLGDEFDAADDNVALVMNSALSNGILALPNRPGNPYAVRHKDFVFIAAANTVGTGASRTYNSRKKLDMATLDRFNIGKVYMDYDPRVEEARCPDETLRTTCLRWRRAINAHGLERAMSTRFMKDAYEMMHGHPDEDMRFTMDEVADAFFQGWREDEINKVKNFRG